MPAQVRLSFSFKSYSLILHLMDKSLTYHHTYPVSSLIDMSHFVIKWISVILIVYRKCNYPINPHVRPSVGWSVSLS